jgi:DNA-binding GntR family transcriptional regulator
LTGNRASRSTIVERLARELADDIAEGALAPGVKLDEQALALRFGVSRTPVRETLNRLASSGLVEKRPHRGVVVANVTLERLLQMFEVMTELEGACARFAAERMSAVEKRALVDLHRASRVEVEAGDLDGYDSANRQFHRSIYEGGRNPFLVETTLDMRRRLQPFRRAQFRLEGRLASSHAEHQIVVEAIRAGDGEAAYRSMRAHILAVKDAYRSFASLADVPGPAPARLPELELAPEH